MIWRDGGALGQTGTLLWAQGQHGGGRTSSQMMDAAKIASSAGFQNAGPKS